LGTIMLQMNWDFTAKTAAELATNIRPALVKGVLLGRVAFERLHMVRLLEALAGSSILQYPLSVKHTTEQVPDFQLALAGRLVSAELTRIEFQDIECGRALQQKSQARRTLAVTRLLPDPNRRKPRKQPAVTREGFGAPPMLFPSSVQEQEAIWLKQGRKSLDRKSSVFAGGDFAHGKEDWLVLVDPVGVLSDTQTRLSNFSGLLAAFWKPTWFTRVFLQDYYFEWQMVFTRNESFMLSSASKEPPNEVLERDFQILPADAFLFEP
jgi:hypothetical protein